MDPKIQSGLLHAVREIMPRRALTFREALASAEAQANKVLLSLDVTEPPLPDHLIEELPQVEVVRRACDESGRTAWAHGHWLIQLDSGDSLTRQRFTLMHELKHVLDAPLADCVYPELSVAQVERVCDHFAGCLLMPKRMVKQLWWRGIRDPEDLADFFQVSRAAMAVRLRVLRFSLGRVRAVRHLVRDSSKLAGSGISCQVP
ncbi:ImmA/IrrE family metallo-endopeptidase [Frankia sp. R43]|uniref:ImmA/IrrE family metallo-endopeptidase n=1 Tax=Frankia sp. R43 TaxID=269536 RepID=UPI0006CA0363|nr:ImmA/IrrE family metallo-endopeptidase [Frankia sp. R43]